MILFSHNSSPVTRSANLKEKTIFWFYATQVKSVFGNLHRPEKGDGNKNTEAGGFHFITFWAEETKKMNFISIRQSIFRSIHHLWSRNKKKTLFLIHERWARNFFLVSHRPISFTYHFSCGHFVLRDIALAQLTFSPHINFNIYNDDEQKKIAFWKITDDVRAHNIYIKKTWDEYLRPRLRIADKNM